MEREKQIEEICEIICKTNGYIHSSDYFLVDAEVIYNADYRKVVMCKDCVYCDESHYEENGEKPYVKFTCKWSNYAHHPSDFCSLGKKKGERYVVLEKKEKS